MVTYLSSSRANSILVSVSELEFNQSASVQLAYHAPWYYRLQDYSIIFSFKCSVRVTFPTRIPFLDAV